MVLVARAHWCGLDILEARYVFVTMMIKTGLLYLGNFLVDYGSIEKFCGVFLGAQ